MKMEEFFKLRERKTDVKTEILAGITTFMTMAYVLAVQPSAIVGFGEDPGQRRRHHPRHQQHEDHCA